MKIIIAQDDGTIIEVMEEMEDWDLSKSMARSVFADDVKAALDRGRKEPS